MLVPGAVLAAGQSSRMGRSKALLPFGAGGPSFLGRIVATMREGGVDDVLVIGRPEDAEVRDAVLSAGARFVANEHHAHGQLTSIVAAVNAVDRPGVQGLLVMPVDMPFALPASFAAVLRNFGGAPGIVARAVHGGRHGHPVIFGRAFFDALRRADPEIGAKAVLRASPGALRDVEVEDPGILKDIDSPEDYVAAFGCAPGGSAVTS